MLGTLVAVFIVKLNDPNFVVEPKIFDSLLADFSVKLNVSVFELDSKANFGGESENAGTCVGSVCDLDCTLLELPNTNKGFVAGAVVLVVTGGNVRAAGNAALPVCDLDCTLLELPNTNTGFVVGAVVLVVIGGNVRAADNAALQLIPL